MHSLSSDPRQDARFSPLSTNDAKFSIYIAKSRQSESWIDGVVCSQEEDASLQT
jgi:hypothetical protein